MSERQQEMECREDRSEIRNMPICDLRSVGTMEAAERIGKITNVAILILPKDAPPEVKASLMAIPKENVAMTLELPVNGEVQISNGEKELNDGCFAPDGSTTWIINGFAVIRTISPETRVMVFVNGVLCIHRSFRDNCHLQFPVVNGQVAYLDFEDWKSGMSMEIDAEYLSYLEPKTVFMAMKCTIASDVTVDMLKEKQIQWLGVMELTCYQNVAAYVRVHSSCVMEINVLPLQPEADG